MNKQQKKSKNTKIIQAPARGTNVLLPILVIVGFTFIIYIPALTNGLLLWDDHTYTWENPFLRNFDFAKVFSFSTYYMGHYHPLTMLWFHLEYIIFPGGEQGIYGGLNPFWFHLNNIFLHLINTALVFLVVYELKDKKEWKTAAITALLFGIHPMHVESVAWVAELKDVLYSMFFLASALVYIRYLKSGRFLQIAIAFILFILSDLSKAQAITLPVLFLVFDYYKGRKISGNVILEKVPFFIFSVFFGFLAIRASVEGSVINSSQTSFLMNILNGCYSFLNYIFRMFIPVNLCAVHPYSQSKLSGLPFWFYLLPVVFAGLISATLISAKRSKEYLFGFLFYAVTISVMLKLVPVGDCLVNERYSYIPFIGLFFIAGHLYSRFSEQHPWKYLAHGLLLVAVAALSILTVQRIKTWKDNFTFWEDVVRQYPQHWRGYYGLSVLYYHNMDFDKAFENADIACRQNSPAAPYAMRGTLYLDRKRNCDLAIADFKKVLGLHEKDSPFDRVSQLNLGIAWFNKGNFEKADSEYTKTIRLYPDYTLAYIKRGTLYADNLSRYNEAMADFKKALELDKSQKEAALGIGYCYFRKNMTIEAIAAYGNAIGMDASDGRLYYFRALAYAQAGRFSDAYSDGEKSKQLGFKINEKDLESWNSRRK
ncbi:MAG: tetratricopeptide repeat protein [Bacteroidetes bacterium]|nr:tetratricopeptide repeat protein [Bacteroidota bacterium]